MYVFILLFPLMIYPWISEPYFTIPKVFYLVLFVLCTWLIVLFRKKYWKNNISKSFTNIEFVILLFASLITISTLFSSHKFTTVFGTSLRYEGLITLVSYCSIFLFSFRLMNINQLEKVVPRMVLVSVVVSIHGILQHYYLDFLPRRSYFNFDSYRSYGFFDNPNYFGTYLVLILMLASTMYLNKNNKYSIYFFLITCLTFLTMIFTSTRSAWVGTFFGVFCMTFFVVVKRKELWKKWILLLFTLLVIFISINITEGGGYLDRVINTIDESNNIVKKEATGNEGSFRIFIWSKSIPLVMKYFLVGSGPDTFKYVFPNNSKEVKDIFGDAIVDKAHNEYLNMAITLGVPTLLTYLVLVFMVLRQAYKALKVVNNNKRIMIYGFIFTIISYLIQAFFNNSVVTVAPIYWSILGITYGLSTHYLNNAKKQNQKETKTTEVAKIAMIN